LHAAADGPSAEVLDLDQAATLLRVEPALVREMAEQRRLPGRQLGNNWRFSRSGLIAWLNGGPVTPAQVPAEPATAPSTLPAVGQRPSASTAAEVALRDQRVLLGRGAMALDLKLAYGHSEQALWPALRQDQRALDAAATLRYGLLDTLQATVRVPATWQRTTSYAAAGVAAASGVSSDHFAGDTSISLLGVLQHEGLKRPNLIWSLDAVLPSGPGDRGLGLGLVLSKSYDPAVIFASFSYLQGLSDPSAGSHRSLPRKNVGLSLGYTYALNDALAMNTLLLASWRQHRVTDAMSIPPPNEREELQFGLTWQLAPGLFAEPAVNLRLGSSGADFGASLNLSYAY
jgi:excisionase family DNA binding protein